MCESIRRFGCAGDHDLPFRARRQLARPKRRQVLGPDRLYRPRMPDGHPDLQGTYDLATLTPLERPAGTKLVLTQEEAARLENRGADAA